MSSLATSRALPLATAGLAIAALAGLPVLTLAPNRLVPGAPVGIGLPGLGLGLLALVAALLLAAPASARTSRLALAAA
ncbi:hypothetical protein NS228_08055, partial [Methylobacterium indicum]